MTARKSNKGTPAKAGATSPDRPGFKAPRLRMFANGNAAAMSQGHRFNLRRDGDEWVVTHQAFFRPPYECTARVGSLEEGHQWIIEIARMVHDDPEAFQRPQWLVEQREREFEAHKAKFRAQDEARENDPNNQAAGIAYLLELGATKLRHAKLSDAARYELVAAIAVANRAIRSLTRGPGVASEGSNVVRFPGGRP